MNNNNISTTMTNRSEQVSRDYKKFLYARVTHSNHAIQDHLQQIIERQKVLIKYRSMMVEGIDLIPLESNSYKSDPVVISHTIQMIEVYNFQHLKLFVAVLTDLWRRQDNEIHQQKDQSLHGTENCKTDRELDGKEVIDLCSESWTTTSKIHNGEESRKQESREKRRAKQLQNWRAIGKDHFYRCFSSHQPHDKQ